MTYINTCCQEVVENNVWSRLYGSYFKILTAVLTASSSKGMISARVMWAPLLSEHRKCNKNIPKKKYIYTPATNSLRIWIVTSSNTLL